MKKTILIAILTLGFQSMASTLSSPQVDEIFKTTYLEKMSLSNPGPRLVRTGEENAETFHILNRVYSQAVFHSSTSSPNCRKYRDEFGQAVQLRDRAGLLIQQLAAEQRDLTKANKAYGFANRTLDQKVIQWARCVSQELDQKAQSEEFTKQNTLEKELSIIIKGLNDLQK